MIRRDAWEVYSRTLAVSIAVYVANKAAERQLQPAIHDEGFRWATAFVVVQTIAILSLSLSLLAMRWYARLRKGVYDQLRPAIRDRVLALAFEGESWSWGLPAHGAGRFVLEESVAHILTTLKSPGRDRVARFAVERGFASQWVKAFSSRRKGDRKRAVSLLGLISPVAGNTVLLSALEDRHPAVRAEAARALLITADPMGVDRVFRSVLGEPLLVRALLADDLKRHAAFLLSHTVPSVLDGATAVEAARCFEMLIAWQRALPSLDVRPWLRDRHDRLLQPLLLALLPYVWIDESVEQYLLSALESPDSEIRSAAAHAAGRLKLERSIPLLAAALGENRPLALAAATAIGQMGHAGERHLEKIVTGSDRNAARFAMEALEHMTVR